MSSSVSGTFKGWEGYYNFYNIGELFGLSFVCGIGDAISGIFK